MKNASCLIVDVRTRGSDGLQLQSQLAAACSNIPMVFITADEDKECCRRALAPSRSPGVKSVRWRAGLAKNLIAVIDDDESVRRSTRLLIESFGFRSVTYESAKNFLDSGHLADTSCLIVDVQIPGMNGLELQNQLAAAGSRIPIIFITAYDDQESRRLAMQAGAVAFLSKPFSDTQLLKTIRSGLRVGKGTL